MTRQPEQSRINLALTPEFRERLEALRDSCGATSFNETIRRALSVYEVVVSAQKGGGKFWIGDDERGLREIIIAL